MNHLVLFDGECNLCDHSVQFIIQRDKKARYTFASRQSEAGKEICRKYHVSADLDSLIFIENNQCYDQSTAVLKICKNLTGAWKLFYGLIILPKPVRDYFYKAVARNRYKWFGKKDHCLLPSPEIKKRFL